MVRIVLVAVVGLVIGAGCGLRHPARDWNGSPLLLEPPGNARRLQVVRVVPATGGLGGSGFPIAPGLVLTAAHVCDGGFAMNVDGLPMVVVKHHERLYGRARRRLDRREAPYVEDWVVLGGNLERFTPNTITFGFRPAPGQEVLVGGFFLGEASAAERRRLKPAIVKGLVVQPGRTCPQAEGTVWVKVPPRDYGGFSGGPVACRGVDGRIRVWGVFVARSARKWSDPLDDLLIVAPLPRELQELAQSPAPVVPQVMAPLPQPVVEEVLQVVPAVTEKGTVAATPIDPRTMVMAGASLRGGILAAVIKGKPWVVVGDHKRLARVLDESQPVAFAEDWVLLRLKESRYPTPNIIDPRAKPNAFALALAWSGFTLPNVIDPSAKPPPGAKVMVGGFHPPPEPGAAETRPNGKPTVIEGRMAADPPRSKREAGVTFVWVPPGNYSGFLGGPVATVDDGGRFRVWGIVVKWQAAKPSAGQAEARLIVASLVPERLAQEPRNIPRIVHTLLPAPDE